MGTHWILFALLTVVSWGVYGILLHKGNVLMADPLHGRYKAFLWVGLAYFLVAVIGPIVMIKANGGTLKMTASGANWSFWAGVAGAIGAFGALLALGAAFKAQVANPPAIVMAIIFAGAPVVNGIVSVGLDRMAGKKYDLPWPFILGMALAAFGGFLVTKYKPAAPPAKPVPKMVEAAPGAAESWPAGYADVTKKKYEVS
jgi:drug/metabolite transporter (DMT)-like permease